MNSFYLSEYFVISFLCTIFANINRTIKKHHRFSIIIIDTIPYSPASLPYHIHSAASSFQSTNRTFPFYNNVPAYTHVQARISLFFL